LNAVGVECFKVARPKKAVEDRVVYSSVGVKPEVKKRLAGLRVHPRESFNEVIERLIEGVEKNE